MRKRQYLRALALTLSLSLPMQSLAAGWVPIEENWYMLDAQDQKVTNSWYQDSNGHWYFLDESGAMKTGWKLINEKWYFFNTIHDGTYGRVLTGWQWIDGYCYAFADDGAMYVNTVTPDGYTVNENGAWTEHGTPIYEKEKGIQTIQVSPGGSTGSPGKTSTGGSSGRGGSGGGGGSGGRGGSSGRGGSGGGSSGGSGSSSSGGSGSGSSSSGGNSSGGSANTAQTYSYTVHCIDQSTEEILKSYQLTTKRNDTVTLDYTFDGYQPVPGQSFSATITENDQVVTLYYEAITEADKIYRFTIQYIDRKTGHILGTKQGEAEAKSKIQIEYPQFKGFIAEDQSEVYRLDEDGMTVKVYYKESKNSAASPSEPEQKLYSYEVTCYDFETEEMIGHYTDRADAGEIIEVDYSIPGYTACEAYSFEVEKEGQTFAVYYTKDYQKESDVQPGAATVNFTIEFVDVKNPSTHILNEITGSGLAGETIPVYFYETVRTADGRQWQSINHSPRMFELIDTDYNVFTIEYQEVAEDPAEEVKLREYSIRYVAEDTGATLGITTGYAAAGSRIPFRNNLGTSDYGILDPSVTKMTVSKQEAENHIEVLYKRISFPGPAPDPTTGQYIGSDWTVLFVDNQGNHVLPSINGFSLKDTALTIDYPDEAEADGVVYRAKKASPYYEIQAGTAYKQIVIEYTAGEEAQSKLDSWKQTAHDAKEKLFGTNPFSYFIQYKENNSWNDIALRVGVGSEGTSVTVPIPEITDYVPPSSSAGRFILNEDGISKTIYYTKFNGGSSHQSIKTEYKVSFEDEHGTALFVTYSGLAASDSVESVTKLPVYYPNHFIDKAGNRWEAEVPSPTILSIDTLSLNNNEYVITYKQIFENPKEEMVVASDEDALSLFEAITSRISDASEKTFYLIGKDYSPKDMNPGAVIAMNDLKNYSNELVDTFVLEGVTYYVSEIHVSRTWEASVCTHDWQVTRTTAGTCLVNGSQTLTCTKCGETLTTIIPALGHIDLNHDSVCDTCGVRAFEQILGDEILVEYDSGPGHGNGVTTYSFICVDDNYQGTGNMLYLSADDMPSSVYGSYSYNDQVRYEDSELKVFLNDSFADGLSLKGALNEIGTERVTILSKEELDQYKANAQNNYLFPSGTYLTKTTSGQNVMLSNGTEVPAAEASNYPARPAILLNKPIAEEAPVYTWKLGDVQAREIDDEIYLFRCVNEAYKDKTNSSKKMALFLCDSVIPADIIDDSSTETIETLFFGTTNNYKYSNIHAWLEKYADKSFASVNIGVDTAYSGTTQQNGFSNLNERLLRKHALPSVQYMESKLFIPSVEEAVQIKEYLWRFGETNIDNPETQKKPFCYSYWLRTPEYQQADKIYTVNLDTGKIEAKDVNSTLENSYSETGIRPVFTMNQYE